MRIILCLDGAVIKLKCACPQQDPTPPSHLPEGTFADQICKQEKAANRCNPTKGMKKTIRDESNPSGGLIIKVMPMEQLMKKGFVKKGHPSHTK
jgi:hypothetical protein